MPDRTLRDRSYSRTAYWDGVKPTSMCGHEGAERVVLVQYSSSASGMLHTICDKCFREQAYLVVKVTHVIDRNTGEEYG